MVINPSTDGMTGNYWTICKEEGAICKKAWTIAEIFHGQNPAIAGGDREGTIDYDAAHILLTTGKSVAESSLQHVDWRP